MAIMNGRLGKCSNFGNCSIADARAKVEVAQGVDFVCTECGKPLLPLDSGEAAAGGRTRLVGVLFAAALALAGAGWFLTREKAPAPVVAADPPPAVSIATPAPPPPPKPAARETGDCSMADQSAGVCTRAR